VIRSNKPELYPYSTNEKSPHTRNVFKAERPERLRAAKAGR